MTNTDTARQFLYRRQVGLAPRTVRCEACGSLHTVVREGAGTAIEVVALQRLAVDLAGCHEDVWRMMQAIWRPAPDHYMSAHAVCRDLAVCDSTMAARFTRAGLPPLKTLLLYANIARVAALAETPLLPLASIAHELRFSSPQTMGRMLRRELGMPPGQARLVYTGDAIVELFRARLILPQLARWQQFVPLLAKPRPALRALRRAATSATAATSVKVA